MREERRTHTQQTTNVHLDGRSEVDILDLDRTLARYAHVDPRGERVVELRIFGGFKEKEIVLRVAATESACLRI